MIVEWLMTVSSGFVDWFASLFPQLELPAELVNVDDALNTVASYGDGMGAFVNWTIVGLIAAVPITVWCAGFLIKIARVLIAHIPFVGGKG